eukprot:TRINITY_DN23158_c0_g1_i1.p2 TRINITY_DN23158_c0_g1~~TRINITY_DN23158_c0_g1_i1.p2  ORF type:complete len:112 (+),score=15.81 TRINITY_DN23158_c0_g1_i1:128-463(+)
MNRSCLTLPPPRCRGTPVLNNGGGLATWLDSNFSPHQLSAEKLAHVSSTGQVMWVGTPNNLVVFHGCEEYQTSMGNSIPARQEANSACGRRAMLFFARMRSCPVINDAAAD